MTRNDTWRALATPIIAAVIEEVGTEDTAALRRALRNAYPFGEKRYWPYKVWLDEIRRQLRKPGRQLRKPGLRQVDFMPNQLPLF